MKFKVFDQWDNFLGYLKEELEIKDEYTKNLIEEINKIRDEKEKAYMFASMQAFMMIAEKCVEDEDYAAKYFVIDRNEKELKAKYHVMLTRNNIKFTIKEEDS